MTTMLESIHVLVDGGTPEEAKYAGDKVGSALRHTERPVLYARTRLTRLPDPALARPCVAQVNIDLNGRLVRAQAAAATMREAIDEIHDRLRDRITRVEHHEGRHTGAATAGETAPLSETTVSEHEEHEVVRRKTYPLTAMTVDDAVYDMELLDYGFFLFVEAGTHEDSCIYRSDDDGRYHLAQLAPHPDRVVRGETDVVVDQHHAPRVSVPEAIGHLEVTHEPFLFFCDAISRRGCVLYHRYDGEFGLVVPAE